METAYLMSTSISLCGLGTFPLLPVLWFSLVGLLVILSYCYILLMTKGTQGGYNAGRLPQDKGESQEATPEDVAQ